MRHFLHDMYRQLTGQNKIDRLSSSIRALSYLIKKTTGDDERADYQRQLNNERKTLKQTRTDRDNLLLRAQILTLFAGLSLAYILSNKNNPDSTSPTQTNRTKHQ